jgi:hypothetical protein
MSPQMRDIAATALWICLLKSPGPDRSHMSPQVRVISPPRHSRWMCLLERSIPVRGPHVTSDMCDIAAMALWTCLLSAKASPGPDVTSDMHDIAATALRICQGQSEARTFMGHHGVDPLVHRKRFCDVRKSPARSPADLRYA